MVKMWVIIKDLMNIHCLFSSISSLNEIRLYKASYFAVYNVYSCSNIYVTRTAEK